jgi:hypothetical protein
LPAATSPSGGTNGMRCSGAPHSVFISPYDATRPSGSWTIIATHLQIHQ